MGSIPKMPGKSCLQIKINQGEQAVSGIYWLNTTGFMYQVKFPNVSFWQSLSKSDSQTVSRSVSWLVIISYLVS